MNETKNTAKAREYLKALTSKPIFLTTLEEEAVRSNMPSMRNYSGATIEEPERFVIALNHKRPQTQEASFVHEVIHQILVYSKYPMMSFDEDFVRRNLPPNHFSIMLQLQGKAISSIEHPEVYRQMIENYDLDMDQYFNDLVSQKLNRQSKTRSNLIADRIFSDQQDILEAIEYNYYSDKAKELLLPKFSKVSTTAVEIASDLINSLEDHWFRKPEKSLKAGRIILTRIIQHGDSNELGAINNVWKALRLNGRD